VLTIPIFSTSTRPCRPPRAGLDRSFSSCSARIPGNVTIPLPDWLLEANRAGPADLTFVSLGGYGPHSYLLFPVIPPPWSTLARRDGSPALSPTTSISASSLDWWAHEDSP
jgi:hypothetical protein